MENEMKKPAVGHRKIKWHNDLDTGIELIDKQHKEFIRLVNCLLDDSIKDGDGHILKDAFLFLKYYVCEHFGAEEAFMVEYKYLHYAQHKTRHLYFRSELDRLSGLHLSGSISDREVALKLNYLTTNWFLNHIKTEDRTFCNFLLEKAGNDKKGLLGKLRILVKGFFKTVKRK
ncbi:MAG TPA: hypothetical protein DCZ94_07075 [Lentisphaeria bacterium]|nr:MAG: hypothetical protein A2X48_10310 [Lentisphaerae bacterium GWF2_49_21]HBC86697.1 hypothetical protein [Lentisphaeria bacterium]